MIKGPILAIDTSCDDTSAAVTMGRYVLSNVIASQTDLHRPYGGVFPTVAKQAHRENIAPTVIQAMKKAKVSWTDIKAIAVTQGPGLAPALEVGIEFTQELANQYQKPLIPVNHIEGHILSVLALPKPQRKAWQDLDSSMPQDLDSSMPDVKNALSVIVSGGHTEFVLIEKLGKYKVLGQTLDDAAGECLDKIGRMINLGYPAGPVIEEFAKLGNPKAIPFPLPLTTTKSYDLSYSGLKTFARNKLEEMGGIEALKKQDIYDFAASTQYSVFRHIMYKLSKLLETRNFSQIWLDGGVAANVTLRRMLRETIKDSKMQVTNPKLLVPYAKKLCMDNAGMVGVVGAITTHHKSNSNISRQPKMELT
ncbi:MAG: tRNA (adenosine(37)-N6)-threonylcarbamoyltransferase complex transferase subunit TsaD [Candidatus Pacebacteria bacterium CG_4_10_14_0_8_um_filter_42_14]|nr:MAG: tRNA (adenosine(37)-N6)-threonylcarbamoyltransferase complex transferase subunit TsaD [Candidatus Pacebacteria bacterium CG_4_10_14_0_8_um_filter_42_14]